MNYEDILRKANEAGQAASLKTGIAFNPITINSSTLGGTTTPNFQQPQPTPTPSIPSSADLFAPTAPEQQAQGLVQNLQELNQGLAGESAFRTQQEEAQGIAGLTQTQRDLTTQLNNLTREAQILPIQKPGQGIINTQFSAGMTNEKLRENAIKALTVSSLLEASRGNLATAQDLVDRAVKAKYDPIKAEIAAKQANLDLIIKSPEYTLAEKKRAQQQLDYQNKKEKEVNLQESERKAILDIAREAAGNGLDAINLQKITNATSQEEALKIVGASGIYEKPTIISGGASGGTSVSTKPATAAQQLAAGYAKRVAEAETTLNQFQNKISGMSYLGFQIQKRLPSAFQSSTFQQYDQAARNFINAILRPESGAAIAQSEFDNAYKQYIPVAGDNQATLALKAQNRKSKLDSLIQTAGVAYSGNQNAQQTETYIAPDGIEYVKGEDGLYYPL